MAGGELGGVAGVDAVDEGVYGVVEVGFAEAAEGELGYGFVGVGAFGAEGFGEDAEFVGGGEEGGCEGGDGVGGEGVEVVVFPYEAAAGGGEGGFEQVVGGEGLEEFCYFGVGYCAGVGAAFVGVAVVGVGVDLAAGAVLLFEQVDVFVFEGQVVGDGQAGDSCADDDCFVGFHCWCFFYAIWPLPFLGGCGQE